MPVRLNGATSGYTELSAPAVAGITTMTMPTASGTLDRLERAGNILQVVTASTSTEVSHNTESMIDTGLSVNITPSSATSKILILVTQPYRTFRDSTNAFAAFILLRGSTQLTSLPKNSGAGFLLGYNSGGATTADQRGVWNLNYLDSPATTSQVTYKTQMAVNVATSGAAVEAQENGTTDNATSYITAMEVAG